MCYPSGPAASEFQANTFHSEIPLSQFTWITINIWYDLVHFILSVYRCTTQPGNCHDDMHSVLMVDQRMCLKKY